MRNKKLKLFTTFPDVLLLPRPKLIEWKHPDWEENLECYNSLSCVIWSLSQGRCWSLHCLQAFFYNSDIKMQVQCIHIQNADGFIILTDFTGCHSDRYWVVNCDAHEAETEEKESEFQCYSVEKFGMFFSLSASRGTKTQRQLYLNMKIKTI